MTSNLPYGTIFEEYLRDYEFWGFGDVDVIYGDVAEYVRPLLGGNDIISCRRGWISGSFCLLRNCERVNSAYRHSADWVRVVSAPEYKLFDEMGGLFFNAVSNGTDVALPLGKVDSFTHVVKRLQRDGILRCSFEDWACEDIGWGENLLYEDGKIISCRNGAPVMYVHTVVMKRRFFYVPQRQVDRSRFYLRKTGIYPVDRSLTSRRAIEAARILHGGASCFGRLLRRYVR